MSKRDEFKDKYFKSVRICSEDGKLTCSKCGESSEEWIQGILKHKKTRSIFTYPDLKPRASNKCSSCTEKLKLSKIKKKEYSKIFLKECEMCNTPFVSRTSKGKFCSNKCRNTKFNSKKLKTYELECVTCKGTFTNNRKKKFCSRECALKDKRVEPTFKSCKTCNKEFPSTKSGKYCSGECKTLKPCKRCNINKVTYPKRVCEPCKKAKKEPVSYDKKCLTCGSEFSTVYNYKKYCKPSHSPVYIEGRALRKRTTRKAKLSVESWNDISRFKDDRPSNDHHMDHIIPLSHPDVCGLHNTWNFQWLKSEDNCFKSNKFDGTVENDSWKDGKLS